MGRSRKTRPVLKWVGTLFCGLTFVLATVSLRWWLCLQLSSWFAGIGYGGRVAAWDSSLEGCEFHVSPVPRQMAFDYGDWSRLVCHSGQYWDVTIPFWMLLVLAALPTAFLWWRDRRSIPPGHCRKCGYNLTGNVSGRCPECGTPVRGCSAPTSIAERP
jgi:hypothetical protein